jgi:hypothetical protein
LDTSKIPKIYSRQDIESAFEEHLLSKEMLRKIKERIKLPGSQIERLANILIYGKILS